ncbi:histidine kinase [Alicycliphilus sp. B1]|nr:histidine kinase [Alicycliphilus sp. B1]
MHISPRIQFSLKLALMGVVMAAIFVADTATSYEVAAAVFYTVVILTAVRVLSRRALIALAAICIVMTAVSLAFTPHGNLRSGLINMGISIVAIVMTTYLVLKMEAARTAAHEAQAHLMRIARVKSMEALTTSIAHEVNQPLAAIVTSGNACQRWLGQEPPNLDKARQALDRILSDAGRASNIIARVRSLTRGEPPHKSKFDFNKAILEIIALSQAEMERNGIRLVMELSPDLPLAIADQIQIQQVVGNVVLNAIDALAPVPAPMRSIRITSETRGNAIVLAVSDTGIGIPAEVYEHLFEAFWTTKEEGIGVGLSISRAIIEANGGQIWAARGEHGGAVFRFSVPIASQEKRQ